MPSDERLAEVLEDARMGYGLLTAAFVDYQLGLATERDRLLVVGDRKAARGLRMVQGAAQRFIEVAREATG